MEKVLKYRHGKIFAVKDADDHHKREESLPTTAEMFDTFMVWSRTKKRDGLRKQSLSTRKREQVTSGGVFLSLRAPQ